MDPLGMFGPLTFRYRRNWWNNTRIHRRFQYRYYLAPRVVRWTMAG
jgi:hypothetical protein